MIQAVSEQVRVLLVEDDAEDAALTQRLLQSSAGDAYTVDWRDGFATGLEALAEHDYDVMLLDFRLSGENGLDLLRSARDRGVFSPAILLTGQIDRSLDLKAMQAGVVDFLVKNDLNAETLERSIRYAAGRGRSDRERSIALDAERHAREDAEEAHTRIASILSTLESERTLFREVLEQLPIGVVIAAFPTGVPTFMNSEVGRMLGYSPGTATEHIAFNYREAAHLDGTPLAPDEWPMAETLRTGQPIQVAEMQMRRADATIARLSLHSALVRDANGNGIAGVVTVEDVTKRSEAVATASFQAHLLDAVEQAVIATGTAGVVTYWNAHAERLFGWSAAEALGKNIAELMPTAAGGDRDEEMRIHRRQSQGWSGETQLKTRAATAFPAYVAASPIRDPAGAIVGAVRICVDISSQKKAEEAQQQSEAFFAAAFLSSAVPSLLVSADLVVMQCNRAMTDLLGYGDESLVGTSVNSFTHADDRGISAAAQAALISGDQPGVQMEKRYVRRDGSIIDVVLTVAMVAKTDSRPAYFTTQVFDISNRKRAERALLEREQHLANIVNVQQEVATLALDDGQIIDLIVARASSLTGADGAALALVEDDSLLFRAGSGVVSGLARGTPLTSGFATVCLCEKRPLRSDDAAANNPVTQMLAGELGIQSTVCVPLLDDDAGVGVLAVFSTTANAFTERDVQTLQLVAGLAAAGLAHATAFEAKQALIVERTAALENLGEREALIRSLIENAADPLITLAENGLISYASPALERLLGKSAHDIVGTPPRDLCHAEDAHLMAESVGHILAMTRRQIPVEARMAHRDGSWRTVRITGRNMLQDPAVRGIVVNLHDMTDEAVIASQLRQAQKLEAVGQLAGGVAHDFNNMLTVISGHSEFLTESLDVDDERYDDVRQIRLAADRAAALTRQLLAFSRQQMLQPKVVDVNEIVAGMQPMLRRLIGEDITIVTRACAERATVFADPDQLGQVVMNLAINARDAMPSGGTLTVEVQLTDLDDAYPIGPGGVTPGRYVMLAITDTGMGMSNEVREHIFDPFFSTKGAGKGTGLGLSTVYGIVKQSNGYISVYSEPGLWSAFKVYFPLTQEESEVAPPTEVAPLADGSETILLVEDEDAVRRVGLRILKGQGYRVLEASDGVHALEVAEAFGGTIDLLVTDMVMPRMNGRALAEVLTERIPSLRVLFLSGYTSTDILRRRKDEPEEQYRLLQKPFTTQGLATAVREALQTNAIVISALDS
jgi:two-component system cell cycle sensor histidine kinase/response regulator CckA